MFGDLFKNKTNIKSIEYTVAPCTCEGDNEYCDLILQLRKLQKMKKDIENAIEELGKDGHELIFNFIGLLKTLEANGLRMDAYYTWMAYDSNINIIKSTIDKYSSADIFRITEELKTYRNKVDIICEKQRALKAVENDILNVKSKLGIE